MKFTITNKGYLMQIILRSLLVAALATAPCFAEQLHKGENPEKTSCHSCVMQEENQSMMMAEEMMPKKNACMMAQPKTEVADESVTEVVTEPAQAESAVVEEEAQPSEDVKLVRSMSTEEIKMMTEGMQQLLSALILLVDVDFRERMVYLDLDIHREENAQQLDALLVRYAHNPNESEVVLNCLAEKYMNEHGHSVICSLLKNFNVADADLLATMLQPFVQKALMGEVLKAMHRCMLYKGTKLNSIMSRA
jgi:hypothetical protein